MCVKAMKREIAVRTMPNVRDRELPSSESGREAIRQLLSKDCAVSAEIGRHCCLARVCGVRMSLDSRMVTADADGDKSGFPKGYKETPDTVTSNRLPRMPRRDSS